MATELNRDNYDSEVLQVKETVLVDFWGEQCRQCMALMPTVERIESEYSGKLKVGKVNAYQNRMLCAKLRVLGLPTFILYKDGVEAKRLTGEELRAAELMEAVKSVVS